MPDNFLHEQLDALCGGTVIVRKLMPEGHPDAFYDGWRDEWLENDASLRQRIKERLGIMILKVHNEGQQPLQYATEGAVGLDLHANLSCERWVNPGDRWKVGSGIYVEIPPGYEAQVRGRSGLALHHGIIIPVGTIDQDYRGEIAVIVFNCGKDPFRIAPGDRIAQLVVQPVIRVEVASLAREDLSHTQRGTNGFGSTGV